MYQIKCECNATYIGQTKHNCKQHIYWSTTNLFCTKTTTQVTHCKENRHAFSITKFEVVYRYILPKEKKMDYSAQLYILTSGNSHVLTNNNTQFYTTQFLFTFLYVTTDFIILYL